MRFLTIFFGATLLTISVSASADSFRCDGNLVQEGDNWEELKPCDPPSAYQEQYSATTGAAVSLQFVVTPPNGQDQRQVTINRDGEITQIERLD